MTGLEALGLLALLAVVALTALGPLEHVIEWRARRRERSLPPCVGRHIEGPR